MGHHATPDELGGWFAGRLPDAWFTGAPDVSVDREEILVVGAIADVDLAADATDAARAAARDEPGRALPRGDARRAHGASPRTPSTASARSSRGACGSPARRTSSRRPAIPVMTRLRQPERRVLDTLVEAGVARSRSEALAWCVKLVGENEAAWIGSLRDALRAVEEARAAGPTAG